MVLGPGAARRRHAAVAASFLPAAASAVVGSVPGVEFDSELAALASAMLSTPEAVPATKLVEKAGMVEAVSAVAEDARYRGRLDERREAARLAQQQNELHQAELQALQVKADLEAESLKMQAKLESLKAAAEARQEAEDREAAFRRQAEEERRLRQEAEAQAVEARARAEKLEAEQREAEQRRREADKSAEQLIRDQKRKLAAVEAQLQEDAAEEQRWKEHVAALRIQGVERVRQARRELERLAYERRREVKRLRNSAATKIQAVYRGHLSRVRNPSALASAMGADTPFRNARSPFARAGSLFQHAVERQWRGGSVATSRWKTAAKWQAEEVPATWQEMALETALMRGSAALRIQSHFRGWHARQHQTDRQRSAVVIQRIFRGWSVRYHMCQEQAATVIQGAFRGRMVRRWLSVEVRAATIIQAFWRGWLLRDQRNIAFKAAARIQAGFRGWAARIWLRHCADAATVLQAATRGMQARTRQRMRARAAVDIQRHSRGWQLRDALYQQQWSTILIQKMWRGFSVRQWLVWNIDASKLITATWRGYVLRRQLRRWRDAAVHIQRRWRGTAARRELASQQYAAIYVQRVQRGRVARRAQHGQYRCAVIVQAVVRAHLVQRELFEHIAAACMIQAVGRGHLARRQIQRELDAARKIQAAYRGRVIRQTMATLYFSAVTIQASFRGWTARRELSLQVRCAVIVQTMCRAHLEIGELWTKHNAATQIQQIWRGFAARQEARRLRLAKERYRAAQLAEFDRMRAELEAEASAESEATQIAREARLRMAVDAVETVFPRPQDADYHIHTRHEMARSILGHDSLPTRDRVILQHDNQTVPLDAKELKVTGLNEEPKLPGINSLFAAKNSVNNEPSRTRRTNVPRVSAAAVAAPPAGIGLYPQPSNRAQSLEWSTSEVCDGVTLTTPSGPAGGKSLMQSDDLATSMRGRLLRNSLQQLENDAATTIQRTFRGWQARADMLLEWDAMQAQYELETQAATLIQAAFRGNRARTQLQREWSTPLSSPAQLSVMYDFDAELSRGLALMKTSRYTEAVAAFELCHAMRPDASLPPYYLAGCLSALSDIKSGIKWLDIAVLLGMDINELMRDPDLKKLRYHPELEVHYGTAQLRYEAAVRLQAAVRGGLTRAKLERTMWEELQTEAATCIQAAVRGWSIRRNLQLQTEAKEFHANLVRVQACWRGQFCRRDIQRQAKAVATIAAYQRMRMMRQMYAVIQRLGLETTAVILIQRIWRGTRLRRELQAMTEQAAAIWIQKAYRGWAARRQLVADRVGVLREKAALQIQSTWRGHAKRQDLLRQMRAVLEELDRDAATKIQAAYRGWFCRRRLAAEQSLVRLQAMWRGRRERKSIQVKLAELRTHTQRETAAIQIQAAFRGWVARTTIEMERCLASLVKMQAIRRGTVARQGVGRMQLRELQERERIEKKLAKRRAQSEQGVIKVQAIQRGRIARRQHPTCRQVDKAARTLQRLLRTVLPREELIARKLRARASMERTLSLQAEDEMTRNNNSVPQQAVEAVVQVALNVTQTAESAASRSLPSNMPTGAQTLEPLSANDWHTIVAAEEHSDCETENIEVGEEQSHLRAAAEQSAKPTPDPNDWAAVAAREQQQRRQWLQQNLPCVPGSGHPPHPGTRKKKPKERRRKPVQQNPFGPTVSIYGASAAYPSVIRQRSNSVPNPVVDQAGDRLHQASLSGTWSTEADLPHLITDDLQRPRTSPGARLPQQQQSTAGVANTILNWSDNLSIAQPESVAPAQAGSVHGVRRQALSANPFALSRTEDATKRRTLSASPNIGSELRSRPGPKQHIEAAENIRKYLTAVEGTNIQETERTLELTGSMMEQLQRQRTWSADASQPRDRLMHMIYGPRPKTFAERQPHLLTENPFATVMERSMSTPGPISTPLQLDGDISDRPRVEGIDGTWSAEAEKARHKAAQQITAAGTEKEQSDNGLQNLSHDKSKQLPSLASDEQRKTSSSRSAKRINSKPADQSSGRTRRALHMASHRGTTRASQRRKGKSSTDTHIATKQMKQQSQKHRPETPEQALAKLVSPSELNASLPPRRDRGIAPVQHLGDALAGTWGHISLPGTEGTHKVSASQVSKPRGREPSTGVVRQRWQPRAADGEENIPFVKSLEKKYGTPPRESKERSSTPPLDSQPEGVTLAEMSEQERKLMGALGLKHDDRKHVP